MYVSYIIYIYIYIHPSTQGPASSTSSPGAGSSAGASGGPWCWATLKTQRSDVTGGCKWGCLNVEMPRFMALCFFMMLCGHLNWNMVMINRWTCSSPANKPIYTNKAGWSVGIASHKGAASKLLYLGYLNYQFWVGSNVGTDLTQWFNLRMPVFWKPYDAVIGFKGRKNIMYLVAHPTY